MLYRILADLIVVTHFAWILFMLIGFVLTAWATLAVYLLHSTSSRSRRFFDRTIFRTLHLCGILYVSLLALLREYCPLTILENTLTNIYDPARTYPGSFLVNYIERFVYPRVNPSILIISTAVIAAFTLLIFIARPPAKIKQLLTHKTTPK